MIHIVPGKCDYCGCCVGVCPEDAIELQESSIAVIEERCTNCR
ncbi:MAG: 4Fe-4S binding protein, partial [Bacteroidetes bacterium]|nr:4Fe-4S binding protein [Bacteroidota bacterium]